MRGEFDNARPHIEEGIRILKEFDLLYMHDAIPQTCLLAKLQSAYGNVDAALSILKKAGKVVAREISVYSTDYANIEETIGSILASAGKTRDAIDHFRYRYDTRFGLPIYGEDDEITGYNIFHARLLIRHAGSGKKYLYDVMEIKKETSKSCQAETLPGEKPIS